MREALFYKKLENQQVQCELCPQNCTIAEGKTGNCKVRTNKKGILTADNYGIVSGFNVDPIEKKPLYHYFPGRVVLSVGSVGCNLHCKFCQNHEISQTGSKLSRKKELSPDSIVNDAMRVKNNIGLAYTYNEPLVFYEFMRDMALLARQNGLKNTMVTNGFFSPEPLKHLLNFIDAFSVDLKAFNEDFYKTYTYSGLQPVKESLKKIKKAGKFIEITNLVIPGLNDNLEQFAEMVNWIKMELGSDTVLHLSRYFPHYKLSAPPTPIEKMIELYELANNQLDYVYLGNMPGTKGQNTHCPKCNTLVIERIGYATEIVALDSQGNCSKCKYKIIEHI